MSGWEKSRAEEKTDRQTTTPEDGHGSYTILVSSRLEE